MKTMLRLVLLGGSCTATVAALAQGTPMTPQVTSAESADSSLQGPQSSIEDVLVTASRTGATSAQRTPIAMSVFSADRLDNSQVINVKDLVALTPSLSVAQVTASAVIYMRGIGSSNVFGGSDPSVTTQLDGVYISRAFGQFQDFADVERLEVLRGPQGTLYGRNAVGGTINIISRQPSETFTGKAQLTLGDYDLVQGQFFTSGPLIEDKLQASIAGSYVRHDDYIDNVVAGRDGTNNADRYGVRGQLRFLPAPGIEMITRADYNRGEERFDSYDHLLVPFRPGGVDAAPLANSIVGDFSKVAINSPQENQTRLWGISQEINVDLTETLVLKSLSAYRNSRYNLFVDSDATELSAQASDQNETSRQISQEFNLTANLERFEGVVGLFYFDDKTSTLLQSTNFPSPVVPPAAAFYIRTEPDSYTRSIAAFAQGTYRLTPELGMTVGVRYTRDRKRIEQDFNRVLLSSGASSPGFPFVYTLSRTFDAFTPKFGLDWQVTPTAMLYGSATRGFKSGGTSIFANTPGDLSFAPETIWSYEGGLKSDWFERRLRLNVSAFRYDYEDLQVQSLIAPGIVAIRNATNAKVTGAEFEVVAKPFAALTLTASYALLDAQYEDFRAASVPNQLVPFVIGNPRFNPTTRTYDATGNRLNAAPEHSFAGSAQFEFDAGPGRAFIRGEYYRQSEAFYDPSNAPIFAQRAYGLVNAAIGWNSDDQGWNVQLIGKNLADEEYAITIAANGLVPAALAGAPRTVALQVTKNW